MSLYRPGQQEPTPTIAIPDALAYGPNELFRIEVELFEAEVSQALRLISPIVAETGAEEAPTSG
jgi:hypothetical protein